MIEHAVDGCNCPGKRCPGCEHVKCRGAFNRSLLRLDGLQVYCRECNLEKKREDRSKHRDRFREENRRRRQIHLKDERERIRAYQEKNREKYREQSKAYHEANREKHNKQMDTYRRNNLEAFAVREANRRARKAKVGGSFTQQEWHNLCMYYDFTCLRCGRQAPEIELTVDHVVPLSQGGRDSIDNLQPLCRACNTSKHAKAIDYRPYFRR